MVPSVPFWFSPFDLFLEQVEAAQAAEIPMSIGRGVRGGCGVLYSLPLLRKEKRDKGR
jgi:hypothetical protein